MNNARRKELERAFKLAEEALTIVQGIKDDEQEALDNLEERFPGSEQVEKMGEVMEALGDADDALEQALVGIEAAKE
jgi:hypothetical protein